MNLISSRNNPKIKQVRALRQRKARQESKTFLVEGIRHVGEAIQSGAEIEAIIYAPDLLKSEFAQDLIQQQERAGVACYAASAEVFDSLADKENPQGILAVVRQPAYRLDGLNAENFPWGVALVSPQDPGNLGAILRTIDAVGASGVLLLESSLDAYHPAVVRASMGAIFWHPLVTTTFAAFADWAGEGAYHIYGTSAHGAVDYREVEAYLRPRILLLGSEREGLSAQHKGICEQLIRLPMRGRATSLNLAVAAGVMLYAMLEREP
jgi:TrmH family RNA methyltransferase